MRTLVKYVSAVGLTTVLSVTACGADTPTGTDGAISLENCGRTVTMDAPAKAAITLNQGAIESALAIGAQGQMVGTAYLDDAIAPRWSAAYNTIPVLAEKFPTAEVALAKHPDLITASYASAFSDKAVGSRESLADLGIATYLSPFACDDTSQRPKPTWDAIAGETGDYGILFGRTAEADEVNAAMRTKLAAITAKKAAAGKSILWWDSNTTTPFVGVGQGGPQLIMNAVGATNPFADVSGNWADIGWESIIKADPDVIVLVDASWDTADSKRRYIESDPALKDLTAVKEKAYIVVPFSESTPGARLIDGAQRVSDALVD